MFEATPLKNAKAWFLTNQVNFDMRRFWKLFFWNTLRFDISGNPDLPQNEKSRIVKQVQKKIIRDSPSFCEYLISDSVHSMRTHLQLLHQRLKVILPGNVIFRKRQMSNSC